MDLETALNSIHEEKRMLERELLSIRSQLQMRGGASKLGATLSGTLGMPPMSHQPSMTHNNSTSQLNAIKPGDAYFMHNGENHGRNFNNLPLQQPQIYMTEQKMASTANFENGHHSTF